MKIEGRLFALAAVFFFILAIAYWFLSYDPIGTTALTLSGFLSFLVAFYVLYTAKRVYPRPEDRLDAEIDEADPEYGFYSPHSWWPLPVAFGAALVVIGLVFAVWIVVLGVAFLMLALIGWTFEYYRGDFSH